MDRALVLLLVLLGVSCDAADERTRIVVAGSTVGREGAVLQSAVAEFERLHPDVDVEIRGTPDGGDERHQLYVQWLNAGSDEPDLLQLDVVWTPELAAAGFLLPLDDVDTTGFFEAAVRANRFDGRAYAVPWFVDVGMLYRRTDLAPDAPRTLDELAAAARARPASSPVGFAWQGARYEGLVCVFLEVLTGYGGAILDDRGAVVVDTEAGRRALSFLVDAVGTISPPSVVTWQEEQARFSFQNGEAMFMRNWPYAAPLFQDAASSQVVGRFAVGPMPGADGRPGGATLGGQSLAVNARTKHKAMAKELVRFLVADAQQIERARIAGEYPPKASLYEGSALDGLLPVPPAAARAVLEAAVPRPPSPVWTELSGALQVHLHRALTRQTTPEIAIADAARELRAILAARELTPGTVSTTTRREPPVAAAMIVLLVLSTGATALLIARRRRTIEGRDERLGWMMALPALWLLVLVAAAPLVLTFVQSLYDADLRAPWRGAPFVGLGLYADVLGDERFRAALLRTGVFVVVTVSLELTLGLLLALSLSRAFAGRGLVRGLVLVPWSIPAVVAAVLWRFLFDEHGPVNRLAGLSTVWMADPVLAWVPLVAADVWKTTPFVMLLLLAGLAQIDPAVDEAAQMDGAGPWRRLLFITLPLLKPTLLVTLVFRTLDAVRVFDLVYVMTGGGPGTATEPVSLLAFDALLRKLRFGEGAAISVIVFAIAFALAMVYVRLVGEERRR